MNGKTIWAFKVSGKPRPKARPRFVRRGKFVMTYSPKTKWEDEVMARAVAAAPDAPIEGPVEIRLHFFFKARKKVEDRQYVVNRVGDFDNLAKSVSDCMTKAAWWNDDSQVAVATIIKTYTTDPLMVGVMVEVNTI